LYAGGKNVLHPFSPQTLFKSSEYLGIDCGCGLNLLHPQTFLLP
jgi:hypothetical protein